LPDSMNSSAIFKVAEKSKCFGMLRYIGWLTGYNAFSRVKAFF